MTELVSPNGIPLVLENPEEDPYATITVGISFSPADILGRKIENEQEAEAFDYLSNKFIGSEFLYEHLKAFVRMHFDTALTEVKSREIIAPSSNG